MKRIWLLSLATMMLGAAPTWAGDLVRPAMERFAQDTDETPNLRRHVIPLAGRLGCNGRACHGSFQGQGGFRLSLFGYDFDADHKALMGEEEPRIDLENPTKSLVLLKATTQEDHDGGKRLKLGTWQYRLMHKWIQSGAENISDDAPEFASLEVVPKEIIFKKPGEKVRLQVIVNWTDGSREDVTCLSRFRTNNDQVATISEDGLVTATKSGDTHVVAFYDNGIVPIPVMQPISTKK
ncbi:MAG: Ig-like domain-containing protein, partial [Planctomycetales bacterium]